MQDIFAQNVNLRLPFLIVFIVEILIPQHLPLQNMENHQWPSQWLHQVPLLMILTHLKSVSVFWGGGGREAQFLYHRSSFCTNC